MSLVTSLAANNFDLQCNLVRSGVIWSLLLFLFDYDYTLDESGVVTDEKTNQQVSVIYFLCYCNNPIFLLENGKQSCQTLNSGYRRTVGIRHEARSRPC